MRELLGSPKIDDSERAKLFKKMFGYFNDGVFKMMTNKFKKLFEGLQNNPNTDGDNIKFDFAPEEEGQDDLLMDESFAVRGSKVEKFITGKNLKLKGKRWKEIDFETIKIDNRTGMVTLKVLSPKKLFGMETPVTFKTLRRGPFLKTDTSKKVSEGVSSGQLSQVEKYLDKLWGKVGIDVEFTRHFMDRVNDRRNDKPISSAEVMRIFKQTYKKYGKKIASLGKGAQAVMNDMKTDVNVPFVLKWNGNEFEMIAKTIMRKKNFKSTNKKFAVEDVNIKKRSGKDGGDYRTYTAPEDSDFDEPTNESLSDAEKFIRNDALGWEHYKDWKEKKLKKENITLPIKVGDTVLMGRFKNKRVKIKTIDTNEKGDLIINGRSALKFRMPDGGKVLLPKPPEISTNPFDENTMLEFLTTIDINKIINEVTSTGLSGQQGVDSGPSALMKGMGGYTGRNNIQAEKLGWEVVNYILGVDIKKIPPVKSEFNDERNPVSYMPAGVGTGTTANNPENLVGAKAYNKWVKNMKGIAQNVGYELIKFMGDKEYKDFKKQIAKDTKQTLKKQKKDEKGIPVEPMGESFSVDWWKKTLLTEGGAYGHMAHPFDDKDLTFGDLKKIIELGLGGQLNREDNVTEKLDGQNIMVSWKDGKLIAARNKGHIKNGGATALDAKAVAAKFKGRGEIRNAFVFAMKDLERAVGSLSQKQKDKIFNNGYNFMNLEVMWPKSANVVDYDLASLVFHGALQYDDNGTVKGEVKGSGRMLAGMIQQVNQHIQKHYKIGKPQFLTLSKHTDFGKMKGKYKAKLTKLQSKFGLKDSDTLGLYHQKWWESFILERAKGESTISNKVLKGLVKRWAFFDKSYAVKDIKKDIKNEYFLKWVLDFDKKNHTKQVKENMKPFEILFFQVGAEIMKNISDWMAVNPNSTVQRMKKKLDSSISNVRKGGDLKKLNTLKLQLDKLNAIGGVNAIVPSEGIVFKYNGKTYKFTGAFAPINQITGLISF